MFKYIVRFSKTGSICYTSHLDMMRMFHRIFKRAGIRLSYSQGFNPHPKIGFAQPLPLGYSGLDEMMEFETDEEYDEAVLGKTLADMMPQGIDIISCRAFKPVKKSLAAATEAAEYIIAIPTGEAFDLTGEEMKGSYLGQEHITALKRQKKKKELAEVDIKPMIREIVFTPESGSLFITAILDSGSTSNLSPELVIDTVKSHFSIDIDRSEIEVMRKKIFLAK